MGEVPKPSMVLGSSSGWGAALGPPPAALVSPHKCAGGVGRAHLAPPPTLSDPSFSPQKMPLPSSPGSQSPSTPCPSSTSLSCPHRATARGCPPHTPPRTSRPAWAPNCWPSPTALPPVPPPSPPPTPTPLPAWWAPTCSPATTRTPTCASETSEPPQHPSSPPLSELGGPPCPPPRPGPAGPAGAAPSPPEGFPPSVKPLCTIFMGGDTLQWPWGGHRVAPREGEHVPPPQFFGSLRDGVGGE